MATTSPITDAITQGDVAQVKTLLEHQPQLAREGQGPQGETLLLLAARHGQAGIAALLLDQGADINARGAGGYTPLHLAAQQGNEQLIKLLLEHMADINATTDDGDTAMDLAIKSGHDAAKWFSW
jgi:uncharacterized protein